jgi:hypothetical protein
MVGRDTERRVDEDNISRFRAEKSIATMVVKGAGNGNEMWDEVYSGTYCSHRNNEKQNDQKASGQENFDRQHKRLRKEYFLAMAVEVVVEN